MPRFEDGRFLPIEEDGESCNVEPRSAGDETIERRTIISHHGRVKVVEETRFNPLYASEVYDLEAFYPTEPDEPTRVLGAAYQVNEHLSTEVTYQERTVLFDNGTSAKNRSTTIAFFPEDNETIDVCSIAYDDTGAIRDMYIELDTQEPLVNHPTDQHVMVSGGVKFLGDQRVQHTIQVDDDDELDDGIWLAGKPIDITPSITWTPFLQQSTVRVEVCTPDGRNEFNFPRTVNPKDMKRLLSQDKRIGGVFIKEHTNDVVE